jgi:hypothetical protein
MSHLGGWEVSLKSCAEHLLLGFVSYAVSSSHFPAATFFLHLLPFGLRPLQRLKGYTTVSMLDASERYSSVLLCTYPHHNETM